MPKARRSQALCSEDNSELVSRPERVYESQEKCGNTHNYVPARAYAIIMPEEGAVRFFEA